MDDWTLGRMGPSRVRLEARRRYMETGNSSDLSILIGVIIDEAMEAGRLKWWDEREDPLGAYLRAQIERVTEEPWATIRKGLILKANHREQA